MFLPEQLTGILRSLPDPAYVLTRSGRYAAVFGGADGRHFHGGSGLLGETLHSVLNADKAQWFLGEIDTALKKKKLHLVQYALTAADQLAGIDAPPEPAHWFEGRIQALDFQVQGEDAVLWVANSITERHQLEEKLKSLSETDALTGLWNRRRFDQAAASEHERALRYGYPIALLIFDIDHFKVINDTYGHGVGDEVLTELAQVVMACIRRSDMAIRWGGEEFTILMPHGDLDAASTLAEKIRLSVERHVFAHGLHITISVGSGEWALEAETVDDLLARVDEAMYQAKREGRNRTCVSLPTRLSTSAGQRRHPIHLIWRLRYESGNAQIDRQHKDLFERVQTLLTLQANWETGIVLQNEISSTADLLDALLIEVRQHFLDEEHLLAQLQWTELPAHQAAHQHLLNQADELTFAFKQAPSEETASRVIRFLAVDVIANHLLRSDRAYFPSLLQAKDSPRQSGDADERSSASPC